jgi:hypothetical protein
MDTETFKAISPIVGGALALAAAILSFVNARLKDAEDAVAKANVHRQALEWLSLFFSVFGMVLAGFSKTYILSSGFFSGRSCAADCIVFERQQAASPFRRRRLLFDYVGDNFWSGSIRGANIIARI